jgi:hypothetical protein
MVSSSKVCHAFGHQQHNLLLVILSIIAVCRFVPKVEPSGYILQIEFGIDVCIAELAVERIRLLGIAKCSDWNLAPVVRLLATNRLEDN